MEPWVPPKFARGFFEQWQDDLQFHSAGKVPWPMPLERVSSMKPMIFLAVYKGGILTTAEREGGGGSIL